MGGSVSERGVTKQQTQDFYVLDKHDICLKTTMHYGSKYNQHLFTPVPYSLRYQYAFI